MNALFWLLVLGTSSLWAAPGTVVTFERNDATGSTTAVVHLENTNGSWQTTRVGSSTYVPGQSVAYSADGSPGKGHFFRSVTSPQRETHVYGLHNGAIPRVLQRWNGRAFAALGPFSYTEAIAWDSVEGRLVIVGTQNETVATPRDFLGPTPVYDVSLARIASDEILVLGRVANTPPPPGLPIEYTLFHVRLEPDGNATILSQTPAPKKVPDTPVVFAGVGAFYVASDSPYLFRLRHVPLPGSTDRNGALSSLTVSQGSAIAPVAYRAMPSGYASSLNARSGDALVQFDLRYNQVPHILSPSLFNAGFLGGTTALGGSRGTPTHRVLSVSPPPEPFHSIRYQFAVSGSAPKAAAPTAAVLVRSHLEKLWQDALGTALPTMIAASDLIVVLEKHSMKSDWLAQLLKAADAGVLATTAHIQKMGYPWVEIGHGGTVASAALITLLATVPDCATLLGSMP